MPASKQLFIMKKQGRSENTAKKIENGLYEKKYNFSEKSIAKAKPVVYTNPCCDMIAKKREVAALQKAGFPWSECQVRKLATSHCITNMVYRGRNNVCKAYDTHGEVYSHRLSY